MATIKISELSPVGSELFQDSESFLNELTEREMGNLLGGSGSGGDNSISVFSASLSTSVDTGTSVNSGHLSISNPSGK